MTVKITDYMKKYRLYYLRGFVGMFFYVGMDLLSPMVIQRLIDDVVVAGQLALLMPLLFGLLGIAWEGRFSAIWKSLPLTGLG